MLLTDINVLIYAFREEAVDHARFREWLDFAANDPGGFGVSDLVLSGFIRIVTHRRALVSPTPLDAALNFAEAVRHSPGAIPVSPGPRHWQIFEGLCRQAGATGKLVPDAYLAALAIENGAEFITTDGDFARFPGLRWRHPLRG